MEAGVLIVRHVEERRINQSIGLYRLMDPILYLFIYFILFYSIVIHLFAFVHVINDTYLSTLPLYLAIPILSLSISSTLVLLAAQTHSEWNGVREICLVWSSSLVVRYRMHQRHGMEVLSFLYSYHPIIMISQFSHLCFRFVFSMADSLPFDTCVYII